MGREDEQSFAMTENSIFLLCKYKNYILYK